MRLAEPVPKRNAVEIGAETDGGGLHFCSLKDAVADFLSHTAGKTLFVSDRETCAALAFAARYPRAVSVVLDSPDALPLFSVPDSVCAVFAAGGEQTLHAARFFAHVRRVPCAVAPSEGACFGVFDDMGCVFLDGERETLPLAAAEIGCDVALMRPTLGDARARLSLARLACFEARALSALGMQRRQLSKIRTGELSAEEVVRANCTLRRDELSGAWAGEGATLARMYGKSGAWRAFCELSALYKAFFGHGTPRKFTVPDYAARAKRAGVAYSEVPVPTAEEYARRALALEQRRFELLRELDVILRDKSSETHSVCAFSQISDVFGGVSAELKMLPERCPQGLSAVIRDFGLME